MIRKIVFSSFLIFSTVTSIHAQQVSFRINSGTDDLNLKERTEKNISSLLSEINSAHHDDRDVDFSKLHITDYAKESISMLWQNIHFFCTDEYVVERLLTTEDGYQIRGIPIQLVAISDDIIDDSYQEASVDIDKTGCITSFYFSIQSNLYRDIMVNGRDVEDLRMRQTILDYVEHFRTAYNQRDIVFLEQVFSEDALIITGKVVKVAPTEMNDFVSEKITYSVLDKKQYLTRLKKVFDAAKYINVDFSEIKVSRHPRNPDFYGVLVRQGYSSNTYSDDGYVFLLWDFSDETHPQIHVRTWQPYWMNEEKTRVIPEKEIININKFNL